MDAVVAVEAVVGVAAAEEGAVVAVANSDQDFIELPRVGVGFRAPLAEWILSKPREIEFVEVTAEHFFDGGEDTLARLSELYPISVHGLGLSLGTPGPLCRSTLNSFSAIAAAANAAWVSEHIAFTRSEEVDLGHLNPVPLTMESLKVFVDHAMEVQEHCGRPLLLENITSYLRVPEVLPETEFLNRLCEEAGVGLLLDVTNLFINSKNHGFDPVRWLEQLEPSSIKQMHIVGYSQSNGQWHDRHCEPVQDDLLELAAFAVGYGEIESIILERDGSFPTIESMTQELRRLEAACVTARTH
ncbi:MAG: DUF692 domain-containing protein [Rubripirellula sp.]